MVVRNEADDIIISESWSYSDLSPCFVCNVDKNETDCVAFFTDFSDQELTHPFAASNFRSLSSECGCLNCSQVNSTFLAKFQLKN